MGKIVCIGNAVVDILLEGLDLTDGIDSTKFMGKFLMLSGIKLSAGGDAVNEAIVLGRMGADVSLVVGLGKDMGGLLVAKTAENSGVHIDQIVWDETGRTQNIILAIQNDKEKYFFCEPNYRSGGFHPCNDMFVGASIVSIASLYHLPFDSPKIVRDVIRLAKNNGAVICADVIFGKDSDFTSLEMKMALQGIDYIFPNEEEAYLITGETDLSKQADVLLDCGISNVIIKLGAKGCYLKNVNFEKYYPAFKGKMVDATGAGDSFLAGFCYGLANNWCLDDCFHIATAAGAKAVGSVGATAWIKDLRNVRDVLQSNEIVLSSEEL